ncbi:uncharacterized protein LOC128390888 [Panonychus citri]|uniref:uncharacterized protein LOC128390888 n=1 Tax=Panonychus citri TaxID=50023 RepID=UPI0023072CAF|nr:uncharacterized protein LOC128390888 [Panonychus citri]
MLPNLLIVFILSVQSLTILKVNCDSCPARGKIGGPIVPDVLSLTKGQSGFSAIVEIITPQQESIMVNDNYNGAKRFGHIEVNKLFNGVKSEIYYYHETNEKYVIENDDCQSDLLNLDDKYTTIGSWLVPDQVSDQATLFGDMDYLGPTVLMIWAKSVSEKVQFVATENIDGISMKHWFHCLNENIWIDFWFDDLNNLPFRFSISQSSSSSSSTNNPHVYNFLIFNPIKTSPSDRVSYPLGYACTRSIFGLPPVPSFLQSDSFSLDMEAMISNSQLDKVTISSVHMVKYQATYSFQVTESFNTTRIIQNPNHRGRYIVDVSSGQCQLDNVDYKEIQEDNLAIKWPYHYEASFNLLQTVSSTSAAYGCYMGQVDTDAGLMDIWEDKLFSFFSSGYNMDAVVSYYFPAIDRSSKPHQAPNKISIKLVNPQGLPLQQDLPDQIEINFIDYTEQVNIQFSDQFDVSGCYDGPGQFTWFQIIMSDDDIVKVKDVNEIRNYYQQSLTSFIPVIRIPEIVVNMYDSNYYITGKLLQRPPFIFNYEPDPQYYIDNPTSILIRDALEDCGELCTNDLNCKEFSYCSDSTCQIFSSASAYSSISMKDECTWYRRRSIDVGSTVIERNILASSRSILSQIKSKVNNGQFMMTKYSMSAVDLFIVGGPEEIGNLEEELTDYQVNPLKGDEYTVIAPVRRLSSANGQSTVLGVSYSDCLKLCQNDDDCYTLSYCNDAHRECTLSMETKENLTKSLQDKTSHADNCNIFEKSFVAFYRKFPGQSLVKDSVLTLFDIEESECARVCYESSKIPCKSFDFCLQSTESHGESSQRACFLHQFHVAEDSSHEITNHIWDFSKSTCDHYAVKYGRDYVHYIGRQYKMDKVTIIKEINDVSMERCAVDCNQSDDYVNCISFEYCESFETRGSSNIRTTCRLSSTLTTGANDLSSLDSSSTAKSTCSVYLNKDRAAKLLQFKGQQQDHFGLAIGLGSFFFLASFMVGTVASIYYKRKFS